MSLKTLVGSGSGIQKKKNSDPDPQKIIPDPQPWIKVKVNPLNCSRFCLG